MLVIYFPFSQKQINTFCLSSNLLKKIQNTFMFALYLKSYSKYYFQGQRDRQQWFSIVRAILGQREKIMVNI